MNNAAYWFTLRLSIELCIWLGFLFHIDRFIFVWLWHLQYIAHNSVLWESYAVAKLINVMSCRSYNNSILNIDTWLFSSQYVLMQTGAFPWIFWNSCDWCRHSVTERLFQRRLFEMQRDDSKLMEKEVKKFVPAKHVTSLSIKSEIHKKFKLSKEVANK